MEKKVAIYCRVSTQMQSTDRQESELKEYANKQGYIVTEDCVYVDVISGFSKTEERPQYLRLFTDIEKKGINLILFSELTRLGRNALELQQEIEALQKKEVTMYFLKQNIYVDNNEKSLGTRILLSVLAVTCTYEIELFAERSLSGKINALKNGGSIGRADVNYGYFSSNKKKLEINKEEAETIKEIFKKYANGKSIIEIAEELNTKHIPTHGQIHLKKAQENRKNKNLPQKDYKNDIENMKWRTSTISRMLANKIYTGYRHITLHAPNPIQKKEENQKKEREIAYEYREQCEHLRIISDELFQQVQNRLSQAKYNKNNAIKHNNLLKTKMKCGECGSNYTVGKSSEASTNNQSAGRTYKCYGRIGRHDKQRTCTEGAEFRQWRLDGLVVQLCTYIFAEIQNKNQTNDKIQELQRQNVEINTQIEKITIELKSTEERYKKIMRRYALTNNDEDKIIEELMQDAKRQYTSDKNNLQNQHNKLKNQLTTNKTTIQQLQKLKSNNIYSDIDTIRTNKELLQSLVNNYIDTITTYRVHHLWNLIIVKLKNNMEMWGTIKNGRYKNNETFFEPFLCKYGSEFHTWILNNSEQCFKYDAKTKLFTYNGKSEKSIYKNIPKSTFTFEEFNNILIKEELIGSYSLYDFEGNKTPTFTVEEPQKKATETNIYWMAHNEKVLENLKNKKKD